MMATKAQEREALAKIAEIIEGIGGDDSYVGTALKGCLEDAARNIDEDAAYSMADRLQAVSAEVVCLREEIAKLKTAVECRDLLISEQSRKAAKFEQLFTECPHDLAIVLNDGRAVGYRGGWDECGIARLDFIGGDEPFIKVERPDGWVDCYVLSEVRHIYLRRP